MIVQCVFVCVSGCVPVSTTGRRSRDTNREEERREGYQSQGRKRRREEEGVVKHAFDTQNKRLMKRMTGGENGSVDDYIFPVIRFTSFILLIKDLILFSRCEFLAEFLLLAMICVPRLRVLENKTAYSLLLSAAAENTD